MTSSPSVLMAEALEEIKEIKESRLSDLSSLPVWPWRKKFDLGMLGSLSELLLVSILRSLSA